MSQETEIEILKTVVNKIDSSLEKMSEVSSNLSKIIAVHETRLDRLEKEEEDSNTDMKILHKRITESFADLYEKLHAMEERLDLKYQKQQMNAQAQHDSIQREIQEDIEELSSRIRTLENWRWWMMGIGVGFGFVIGIVAPKII